MHRFLERFATVATTGVMFAYLIGLFGGTYMYYSGADPHLTGAVALALAVAVEVHSFLQQRQMRESWARYRKAEAAVRRELSSQLRADIGVLSGLLLFSCYNSIAYTASTWHPQDGYLPAWLQIVIKGAAIPVLFFLAGWLAPLHITASDATRQAATELSRYTAKQVGRQQKRRVRDLASAAQNLAGVLSVMLEHDGEHGAAELVHEINGALERVEYPYAPALPAPDPDPEPPTSPTRPRRSRGSLQLAPASVELVSNPPTRPAARKRADRGVTAEKRLNVTNSRVQATIDIMRVNPSIGPTELAEALGLDPRRYKGSMTRVLDQARLRMAEERRGQGAA